MNNEEKKALERMEDTFYSDLGKGINTVSKIKGLLRLEKEWKK